MRSLTIILFLTISLAITTVVNAVAQPHMSATIQNMHLWRGMEVADGVVITTDVSISDKSDEFTLGVWGGVNTSGTYKEFDYYAKYSKNRLEVSVWDIYNFSPSADYNIQDVFNYKAADSGRFIDATIAYTLTDKYPLKLSWSTIIYGRDRGVHNVENKYSTFCAAEYPIYNRSKWRCDLGVGGAFALNSSASGANFYGEKGGIVEATMKLTYNLEIGNYDMPITVLMMLNPQDRGGYLQLSAQLISF